MVKVMTAVTAVVIAAGANADTAIVKPLIQDAPQ